MRWGRHVDAGLDARQARFLLSPPVTPSGSKGQLFFDVATAWPVVRSKSATRSRYAVEKPPAIILPPALRFDCLPRRRLRNTRRPPASPPTALVSTGSPSFTGIELSTWRRLPNSERCSRIFGIWRSRVDHESSGLRLKASSVP